MALAALIVVVDQATKQVILAGWQLGESTPVIPGLFSITSVRNRGGAFGLLADLPEEWRVAAFVVFALGTVALLAWMFRETPAADRWQRAALAGVIGGALGNLVDRVRFGEVVDFLDVFVGDRHWPAFNVADSFISVGALVLVLAALRTTDPDPSGPPP